ncbi:hydroxymethylcytosylglucuronate/cytosylglucuronate synthase [Nocardiopsis sp. CNR-923]|uniref:hydroxymethylcytosylglucuronate/cytosylglucurona te synthase n=1 Tax=Nocardiopsis sp. CNR-923 TaxID=1904965 RepID=UPI0009635457|nr:hydroxymethylcytosylglucuronate/cytosylglucuronate synthase [Nocardiopsis sp. CNR-923]OLT25784.1 hydroxymethylcytosylglucuronate/cytosylglucuronate synthase [Nocardiopsis sp. CNR-923]
MSALPALAVCAVDFGWGGAGKLSAILEAVESRGPGFRLVVLGSTLGRRILAGLEVEAWYEEWPRDRDQLRALLDRHGVVAGLVVLDPEAAEALQAVDCPTVYVDSLPYLWTEADAVPHGVTAYCAQKCPVLPRPAWRPLSRIARLHWVDPIVKRVSERIRDPAMAVINLGGLHSSTNPDGNPAYLRLVLGPTLRALARSGITRTHICGNVGPEDLSGLTDELTIIDSVGPRTHEAFLTLTAGAGLLVTSPGLTTLLEAQSAGTPTVCLPPQNLSQIFNSDRFVYTVDRRARVTWSPAVLDRDTVELARLNGEEAALEVIDAALNAADPDRLAATLETDVSAAVAYIRSASAGGRQDAADEGSGQVAEILENVVHETMTQRLSTGVL